MVGTNRPRALPVWENEPCGTTRRAISEGGLHDAGWPGLNRWERATGSIHLLRGADGLPDDDNAPTAFAEDRSGQVWVGLYRGGLARFRNGHFTLYTEADGVPAGMIGLLHLDQAGRLWIGSDRGGLGRIDNPSGANPRIVRYTTSDGLSSNAVQCLTEDQRG